MKAELEQLRGEVGRLDCLLLEAKGGITESSEIEKGARKEIDSLVAGHQEEVTALNEMRKVERASRFRVLDPKFIESDFVNSNRLWRASCSRRSLETRRNTLDGWRYFHTLDPGP
jgi:hypothetical protein